MKKTFFLSIALCLLASCGKLTVARQPQLDEETKSLILAEAQRRGYDTSKLLWMY